MVISEKSQHSRAVLRGGGDGDVTSLPDRGGSNASLLPDLLQALPFPAWIETAPIEEGTEGHDDGPVRRGRVDPT